MFDWGAATMLVISQDAVALGGMKACVSYIERLGDEFYYEQLGSVVQQRLMSPSHFNSSHGVPPVVEGVFDFTTISSLMQSVSLLGEHLSQLSKMEDIRHRVSELLTVKDLMDISLGFQHHKWWGDSRDKVDGLMWSGARCWDSMLHHWEAANLPNILVKSGISQLPDYKSATTTVAFLSDHAGGCIGVMNVLQPNGKLILSKTIPPLCYWACRQRPADETQGVIEFLGGKQTETPGGNAAKADDQASVVTHSTAHNEPSVDDGPAAGVHVIFEHNALPRSDPFDVESLGAGLGFCVPSENIDVIRECQQRLEAGPTEEKVYVIDDLLKRPFPAPTHQYHSCFTSGAAGTFRSVINPFRTESLPKTDGNSMTAWDLFASSHSLSLGRMGSTALDPKGGTLRSRKFFQIVGMTQHSKAEVVHSESKPREGTAKADEWDKVTSKEKFIRSEIRKGVLAMSEQKMGFFCGVIHPNLRCEMLPTKQRKPAQGKLKKPLATSHGGKTTHAYAVAMADHFVKWLYNRKMYWSVTIEAVLSNRIPADTGLRWAFENYFISSYNKDCLNPQLFTHFETVWRSRNEPAAGVDLVELRRVRAATMSLYSNSALELRYLKDFKRTVVYDKVMVDSTRGKEKEEMDILFAKYLSVPYYCETRGQKRSNLMFTAIQHVMCLWKDEREMARAQWYCLSQHLVVRFFPSKPAPFSCAHGEFASQVIHRC